jgi:membrane associated rhomboid family serine protease
MLIPLKTDEPTRTLPIITILLILANIGVFIYQIVEYGIGREAMGHAALTYGAIPYELMRAVDIPPPAKHSPYLSLLTYMFMHAGFGHIISNMLVLNAFGPNVEDIMGHLKFLLFYLVCGVISAAVYIIPNFRSTAPLVGASGAIAGVMGAHLRTMPRTRIVCLFFFIIRVILPAGLILVTWILLQFYYATAYVNSNVAWIAHIGGFVFGMLMVRKFEKRGFYRRDNGSQNGEFYV